MTEYTAPWKLKAAVGIEPTYGNAVTVTDLIPLLSCSMEYNRELIPYTPVDADGFEETPQKSFVVAGGSFETYYDGNNIDPLLHSLMGTHLTRGGTDSELFYCTDTSIVPPSLTFVASRFRNKVTGSIEKMEFPGTVITGATFTGEAGQPLRINWNAISKDIYDIDLAGTDLVNTDDSGWVYPYNKNILQFRQATTVTLTIPSLSNVTLTISSFTIEVVNNYSSEYPANESDFCIGQPARTALTVNAEFTIPNYSDSTAFDTLYTAFDRGSEVELRCYLYDDAVLQGGFYAQRCILEMPKVINDINFKIRMRCIKPTSGYSSPILISSHSIANR